MKKILVTGRGTSGSWQIRGVQLGRAIDADVHPKAPSAKGYDLAILVKRPSVPISGDVPLVWDVVDSWPQPQGNLWGRDECMAWAAGQIRAIKPIAIVAATEAMAEDFREFGLPVLALPHHARPSATPRPIRRDVRCVAYEGGDQYIGRWRNVIEKECEKRGWKFLVNPGSLAIADISLAVREQRGYAARHWKSNVKLANAQGFGIPCILNRESGYQETASGVECWADNPDELANAFDELTPFEERARRSAILAESAIPIHRIARIYREWLEKL